MSSQPARLLCVGKELDLLQLRCAVLATSGYNAQSATLSKAEMLVRTEVFDLIIVSGWLNELEKGRLFAASGKTPALVLKGTILADELLAQVARALQTAG